MYYSGLKDKDVANGIGFGVSLFVSGCRHHCKGCFNSQTWDFEAGELFTEDVMDKLCGLLDRPYVDFFSVLGGEPFEPENVGVVLSVIKEVKKRYPNMTINIWSGSLFEDLIKDDVCSKVLHLCDYLIDGEFHECEKDLHLVMRGSKNQRLINLKMTFETGHIVTEN